MEYGLIGERLIHSYSPEIHRRIGSYDYRLQELRPEELVPFLKSGEFKGINVTIPYKQAVIPCLDTLSPAARAIGAVNTIVRRNGGLYGDNTDHLGLSALLRSMGADLRNKKVLILGTGGTSKTAMYTAARAGAARVIRVSRTIGSADSDGSVVTYEEALRLHSDAEVLINTTPAGMYPDVENSPIDLTPFTRLECVADVIYNPLRSALVLRAQELGIPAAGGLYMLAAQAVHAAGLFFDRPVSEDLTDRVYESILHEKRNIVLIGMPSAGKTTVGRLLAARTGLTFADSDELLTRDFGCPIAEYFAKNGEAAFRDAESAMIRMLSLQTGQVIATGGGAILRRENILALKQNGILVFLDRSLPLLTCTADRPLTSKAGDLQRIYEQRIGLYRSAAELTVPADAAPEAIANSVHFKNLHVHFKSPTAFESTQVLRTNKSLRLL